MRKTLTALVIFAMTYTLFAIGRYWYADILYAKKDFNNAIKLEPNQSLYHNGLASSKLLISESQKAIDLSPNNPNYKRTRFGIFIMTNDLVSAKNVLLDAINYSPTDAKLYYNLGLTYARTGDLENAFKTFQKTIELKSNYKEARLAYAILLINKKQNAEAKTQLEYILKNVDPSDELTKQTLESVK